MKNFYITTTLPYVNADPHIGFALEIVQADVIARYHKLLGEQIFFNTGTDEHGLKIYRKAQEEGKDVQAYCDEYAEKFKKLIPALGVSPDIHFIRTTDKHHVAAAREFWKLCEKNGDIYKAKYKVKYCVGCELEKTESDLNEEGRCLVHPHLEIELIEEENYFFRFSKYQEPLLKLYNENPDFVVPDFRFNEIKQFVKSGLQDFSISRLKSKMPWGVSVPGDDEQVMYVWFDALINYISTLGWPTSDRSDKSDVSEKSESDSSDISDSSDWSGFWPGLQIAGKDNLRQQSAMWQAMLMSAKVANSKQIIIHGFITSGGQKMSKSLGNVADPYEIVAKLKSLGLNEEQATDALRFYLLREIPTFEDGDYTWEKFVESYNANLANGIGNLTSRILKMAVNAGITTPSAPAAAKAMAGRSHPLLLEKEGSGPTLPLQRGSTGDSRGGGIVLSITTMMNNYQLKLAADSIWQKIGELDAFIQQNEPFKVIKVDPKKAKKDIEYLLQELSLIAISLRPFLPVTADKILAALSNMSVENIPRLFPRIP